MNPQTHEVLERALSAGADEAEVYATRGEKLSVQFEKNDLKLTQVDEMSMLGLRVFVGGRLGFASTNQGDSESLAAIVRDALELAKFSVQDEHNVLPAPRPLPSGPNLAHESLAAIGIGETVAHGQELMRRVLAVDPRISIDKAEMTLTRSTREIVTSTGVSAAEPDVNLNLGVLGMARDGEDVGGFDYWGDTVRELERLDAAMDETSEKFTRAVLGNLGAEHAVSYRGPVLFSPQAFLNVFIHPIMAAANALAVQRGRSALAEKLGERIATPSLTVRDDPGDSGLAGATRFDREGQPAVGFDLIEDGVLRGFLYNAYAAHVDGRESTGHASGGARMAPALGPHVIAVEPGDGGDFEALSKTLGRGLYIYRFSGTVDPASGDFSGVAKSARWIENGEIARSLKETLISGNAFELLERVVTLGSRSERLAGVARAPAAIVDGISVTAG